MLIVNVYEVNLNVLSHQVTIVIKLIFFILKMHLEESQEFELMFATP